MRKKTTVLYSEERKWFFAACSLVTVLSILYMYFVSMSVVHVVMRKELQQEILELGSHISELESEYIDVQHLVSADAALLHGYVEVKEKVFVVKTPTNLALSSESI